MPSSCAVFWGVICVFAPAVFSLAVSFASRVFNKFQIPKASKGEKTSYFQKFPVIYAKSQLFLIAIIDDLIYNRVCVSIVG